MVNALRSVYEGELNKFGIFKGRESLLVYHEQICIIKAEISSLLDKDVSFVI